MSRLAFLFSLLQSEPLPSSALAAIAIDGASAPPSAALSPVTLHARPLERLDFQSAILPGNPSAAAPLRRHPLYPVVSSCWVAEACSALISHRRPTQRLLHPNYSVIAVQ